MNKNKLTGSILIIIGTMVGAGMLALPMISAHVGFHVASLLLFAIWAIMTISALYTLEVNLAFPEYQNSFSTMAATTLGKSGKIISWICILLILYSLTTAYIIGNASLLGILVELIFHKTIPSWMNAVLFLTIMGGIVFASTKTVDYCNRCLLSLKGLLLFCTLILLTPQINFVNLLRNSTPNFHHYFWSMIPIFICSFGFHPVIPSLSTYLKRHPKDLKFTIICGSSVTLIIYLLWLFVILGLVPWGGTYGFSALEHSHGTVGDFIKTIYLLADNKWITTSINSFSNIAMTTSFLGVTLGLFDFLADGFKRPNTRYGRLQTALLTFIPPLVFALFYPQGFIQALEYAGLFATILVIILPALMAYQLRRKKHLHSQYQMFGGKYLIFAIIALGIILLGIQILVRLM